MRPLPKGRALQGSFLGKGARVLADSGYDGPGSAQNLKRILQSAYVAVLPTRRSESQRFKLILNKALSSSAQVLPGLNRGASGDKNIAECFHPFGLPRFADFKNIVNRCQAATGHRMARLFAIS